MIRYFSNTRLYLWMSAELGMFQYLKKFYSPKNIFIQWKDTIYKKIEYQENGVETATLGIACNTLGISHLGDNTSIWLGFVLIGKQSSVRRLIPYRAYFPVSNAGKKNYFRNLDSRNFLCGSARRLAEKEMKVRCSADKSWKASFLF